LAIFNKFFKKVGVVAKIVGLVCLINFATVIESLGSGVLTALKPAIIGNIVFTVNQKL
jgi:hypothetical protein